MKPHFSEFTYGFALTNEIVGQVKSKIGTAPIFPSLIEEGKSGGGYDVNIEITGKPIFLQFKLSHYMIRRNASERYLFTGPYYRFELMALRHSAQHNLLLSLERLGNLVYYCAPKFYKSGDLNRNYVNNSIIANSIFIRPSTIGSLPDNDYHSICFENGNPKIYFCSEPQEIKEENLFEIIDKFTRDGEFINLEYIKLLEEKLLNFIEDTVRSKNESQIYRSLISNIQSPIKRISILSRILFNCDFMIIGKENEKRIGDLKNDNSEL